MADSGASLYVLEGPESWWDAVSTRGQIDEKGLRELLKHGLSQRSVVLVGHADFQAAEGIPTEVTLFNPDSKGHRSTDASIGFRIKLKATYTADARVFALEWEAEQLTDRKGKNGEIDRRTEVIAKGNVELPFGASKIIPQPKADGREYTLLLRVITLQEP